VILHVDIHFVILDHFAGFCYKLSEAEFNFKSYLKKSDVAILSDAQLFVQWSWMMLRMQYHI